MARASAAAAVAAGVVEPPEVDPELRSISPISTSGASRLVGPHGGEGNLSIYDHIGSTSGPYIFVEIFLGLAKRYIYIIYVQ